jgi:uncharacterized membrane protein YfhO
MPIINNSAYGHAWFVDQLKFVDNADDEIAELGIIDPQKKAVINNKYANLLSSFTIKSDSSANLSLISYAPNQLEYRSSSATDQVAVFSEIYYPKGWSVKIDGEKADYFRANYILRAMLIPAGNHEIVFTFRPKSYYVGNKISMASSTLLLILLLGVCVVEIRKSVKE